MEQLLDGLLVLKFLSGDQAAFEQIVRRYHASLLYFVRRLIGDGQAAEDVVQQVWMAAFLELRRLDHPEALRVWLYRVARNKAVQMIRHEPPAAVSIDSQEVLADPEPEFSAHDASRIHLGLAKLSPEHREVLVLRFLEQLSYDQIAHVVGCDPGTIKSRLHYAKRMLRRVLEQMP